MEFMILPFDVWFIMNLQNKGKFVEDISLWEFLFPSMCWQLWKRRCGMFMDDNFFDSSDLVSRCRRVALEFSVSAATRSGIVNNARYRGVAVDRHWVKPMQGRVKANADGACNLATNMAAVRGVIHDEHGS
ncbi:hypothetical protein V6N11_072021 [Hibiscus sabdariffa]|uniref:Uncharacterized protein n=1 Tax=Hibiscus sabdariffa TaxID=183260 RepID=A0ABR2U2I9_9ROSI